MLLPRHSLLLMAMLVAQVGLADDSTDRLAGVIGKSFQSTDSLDVGLERLADAKECLNELTWKPASFVTTCKLPSPGTGDAVLCFPSPIASGNATNDRVTMEWYAVRDENRQPKHAPAVVVVHESGSGMTIGRMFARGFQYRGFHAFLIHLPYYGDRREGDRPDDKLFFTLMRQAIADVRRARDAVVSLPLIDDSSVALQGTSLGGMVSATSAALDDGYDHVFLTLAGGELYDMIQNGQKDAAKVREKLQKSGIAGDELRQLFFQIEPTRVAHRLNPDRTWLYSGTFDTVVPMKNALALASAANLDPSHHVKMPANHYTGIIFLPGIMDHMRDQISESGEESREKGD